MKAFTCSVVAVKLPGMKMLESKSQLDHTSGNREFSRFVGTCICQPGVIT